MKLIDNYNDLYSISYRFRLIIINKHRGKLNNENQIIIMKTYIQHLRAAISHHIYQQHQQQHHHHCRLNRIHCLK